MKNSILLRENITENPSPLPQREDAENLVQLRSAALEASAGPVSIVNRDGTIIWVNPAFLQLTGYTREELIGENVRILKSGRQTAMFYQNMWETVLSGEIWRGEVVNRKKDGSFYCEEMTITPIRNKQGEVSHFVAFKLDITERRKAEVALRENEERLRILFDSTAEAIYSINLAGNCTFCNSACARLLGYESPDDLLGKNMHALMHHTRPDGTPYPVKECQIYQAFLKGEGTHADDEVLWREDGTSFPAEYRSFPMFHGEKIVGSVVSFLDITGRKEAAEARRESDAMFERLFESSPDATLAIHQDGSILQLNSQVEKLFGYTQGDLLGKSIEDLIPERFRQTHFEKRGAYFAHSLKRPMAEGNETWGRRKDGTEFAADIRLNPFQTKKGEMVLCVVRDITSRKQTEKALQEAHQRLELALRESKQQAQEAAKRKELIHILQSCQSVEEACKVSESALKATLLSPSGALCITRSSRNLVEAQVRWGTRVTTELAFSPDDCWGLRRGKNHSAVESTSPMKCPHVREFPKNGYLCVPLAGQGETLGVLYVEYPEPPADSSPESLSYQREAFDRHATAVGEHLSAAIANLKLRDALRIQSTRDPLTGLFNRRYMEETLERELRRADRSGHSVAVLMLDIDHFKRFNDTFGHQAGDTLLREFGEFISLRTRGQDVACRYGGEEFALILAEASLENACARAELLREELKQLTVQHAGQTLGKITLSIGISVFPGHGTTADELVRVADRALYRAKVEGRDRALVG